MIRGLDWLEKMPRDRGHRVGDVTQDVEAHGLGNGEHLGVLGALQLELSRSRSRALRGTRPGPASGARSNAWAWGIAWSTDRERSPEESSSALRSPARWSRIRRSDWPTSRQGTWIPELARDIMDIIADANARGTTVIVATHDPTLLGLYPHRRLDLSDGRLVTDEQPRARVRAREIAGGC